jgi:hypothetical protein
MGKRGPKPKEMIDTTWSSDFSYVIGLIASDGCLSSDGRHIDFTSKDKEQILNFQNILKLHHIKIGKKKNGLGHKAYRIQFGSILFYQWLNSIGLTSNKSKTIGKIDVPSEFFFDFFRGVWDGDGTIYAYWDPRWKSSYMFYIGITSASYPFLLWLQTIISSQSEVCGKITHHKTSNTFQLRFAKKESRVVFKKMFYRKNLPHLPRKFAKAQKIFKIDENHI